MPKPMLATLLGGVACFIVGGVVYGVLLKGFYESNLGTATGVVRTQPVWWAMLISQLGFAALLTLVFGYAGVAGPVAGLRTGAIFGIIFGTAIAFDLYAVTNWSNLKVALVEPFVTTGRMALAGMVIGWALGLGRMA